MDQIRLGRTELYVSKTAFGALPIQRISHADAVKLVRRAYESGINYFDTANAYTDSEEKLGAALHDVRHEVIISTKSGGGDKKTVQTHIEESLRRLQTDYIDLFQFHNPAQLPDPEDPDGPFAAVLEAKQKGYIRHIGITNHRLKVARAAIDSGNFETMQFPFCYLAASQDLEIVEKCKAADMGFIAMKGLSGGLLNNAEACYAFMQEYPNVVPIWGIQREEELVRRISAEKARAVREQAGMDAVVIAADTVVALDGAVLGKPADELEAFKMLSTLSGCRHQVYTGLTVLRGEERHTVSEETTVAFRELSEEEISCYIQTGEPMDKAGAYGIQGFGALLIEGIQGDYYNVMGLPVCRLGGILRQLGVDCLRLAAGERDSD